MQSKSRLTTLPRCAPLPRWSLWLVPEAAVEAVVPFKRVALAWAARHLLQLWPLGNPPCNPSALLLLCGCAAAGHARAPGRRLLSLGPSWRGSAWQGLATPLTWQPPSMGSGGRVWRPNVGRWPLPATRVTNDGASRALLYAALPALGAPLPSSPPPHPPAHHTHHKMTRWSFLLALGLQLCACVGARWLGTRAPRGRAARLAACTPALGALFAALLLSPTRCACVRRRQPRTNSVPGGDC